MSLIRLKNQTVPETPPPGRTEFWIDEFTKTIWSIDDTGLITQYSNSNMANFSFDSIVLQQVITIPKNQQMIVSDEISIIGELNVLGKLIIIS